MSNQSNTKDILEQLGWERCDNGTYAYGINDYWMLDSSIADILMRQLKELITAEKTSLRAHALSQKDQAIFSSVNDILFSDTSKTIQANRMMALITSECSDSYRGGLRRALKLLDGTGVWDEKTRNELISLIRENLK